MSTSLNTKHSQGHKARRVSFCGLFILCALCTLCLGIDLLPDRIQHAVDELDRSSVLNVRASSSASLITTARRRSGSRSISQTAIRRISRSSTAIRSGRHRSAVSAISGSIVVEPLDRVARQGRRRTRAARRRAGRRSATAERRTCRPRSSRRRGRCPTDTGSAAPPRARGGAGSLRRRAIGSVPGVGLARQLRDDLGHLNRGDRRLVSLVAGPSPARSSASSTELVVSTPNVIGTPVAAAAVVSPCDTADEMYSKCGVSPRIRQPRQTIASKRAALRGVLRGQRDLESAGHRERP